ncbi:MAG: endo alpha-1,4 polygalactosaminidase [Bacilli bacterium]|nr:endo alpha-1,4 polygalactosaminidase [Bacilli bacterium]
MKKSLFLLIPFALCGCAPANPGSDPVNPDPGPIEPGLKDKYADYGAFLGRSENNIDGFQDYNYVSIDFKEYTKESIQNIKAMGCGDVFGYLNVGSIENYRSYYKRFESITFLDYEDWPDERWIDVSNSEWQDFVINTLAKEIKNKGGTGVYMDNVDVYSVCIEEKRPTTGVISGLKNIIKGVADLGLKVMVNGGAEFFDDMNDKNDSIFNSVWGYHQEEIFSLIIDYEKNTFGKQEKEDSDYYQEIASIMKRKNKEVFLLEYTKDSSLINTIRNYCKTNGFHYYIASNINLD